LLCSKCNRLVKNCGEDAISVVCSHCVQEAVGPPLSVLRQQEKANKIKRPQGWKFMKIFVDSEQNVFFRGVEQPDLKGTLDPTKIEKEVKVAKRKLTPREKEKIEHKKIELYAKIAKIKKSIINDNLTTRMRKGRESEIRKIEKKISKL